MIDNADNLWGRRLRDALTFATVAGSPAYAVSPYVRAGLPDFRPDLPERPDMPDVEDRSVAGVLDKLQAAGYVTTRTMLRETSSQSYLSDGRTVTAVQVLRPFALVGVEYQWSREADSRAIRYGHAYADRWEITDRSYIVPAGWYLVGEIGDYTAELVGVAGMDGDTDGWVFELEGFDASQCAAGCQSCGARWMAYGGSWHFDADDCDADAWDFDDADDIDDTSNTVACPACGIGRVGFDIY
ncbi:hypothetical protein LWC34_30285 [Kibdelosporangium philippinense]|uniref:Uncharacterized protein n=2 Tax=Kibdelosporangium philippinense TaxID=211113 RepID=A0ABS8ZH33_9PSEU|nr:hypothetical protein [Kibdelosporangium philippinense]MCE7007085.1 hypothetical protein [Kibdelosporangium philippinense]